MGSYVHAFAVSLFVARPLEDPHDLLGRVHPVTTPPGDLFEDAFTLQAVHQPACGLEGYVQGVLELADAGYGPAEEVLHGGEHIGAPSLLAEPFPVGFAQVEERLRPAGRVARLGEDASILEERTASRLEKGRVSR